jgi:hypothetical protein
MTELNKAYEKMGRLNEELYKPIIQEALGKVVKTEFKYARIDFYGVDYMGELKSRDCWLYSFDTQMIGYNKIVEGFRVLEWYENHMPNYKVYMFFGLKDGLYSWELTKENYELNGGDSKKKLGGTSKRGRDDFKEHYYIQSKYLKKVSDVGCIVPKEVSDNNKQYSYSSLPKGVCLLKI